MKVKLKRPWFTRVGLFKPTPGGTTVPDMLYEEAKKVKDLKILTVPDEANAIEPVKGDHRKDSFNEFIKDGEGNNPLRTELDKAREHDRQRKEAEDAQKAADAAKAESDEDEETGGDGETSKPDPEGEGTEDDDITTVVVDEKAKSTAKKK